MRAAVFEEFRGALRVSKVEIPKPAQDAVVIKVEACGICRSDWHGWMGHDSDVQLPHIPGHELAGVVAEVGSNVQNWQQGQRVTVPFCCGCGTCEQCLNQCQHICDQHTQPGFTQWGAFAEFVEIRHADVNLVALPDSIDFVTAASLGCRFATSFRAVIHQGRVTAADTVVVHGCGGVGLSAVMIAAAQGARVIGVDLHDQSLKAAAEFGADIVLNAAKTDDIVGQIQELTSGGATVSLDALGSRTTCYNSIACLKKRGRHVQVGLMLGDDTDPPVPMSAIIAKELEVFGSHGLQAFAYEPMLTMIESGKLHPEKLVHQTVTLDEACDILPRMDAFPGTGVTVINEFTGKA